MAHKKKPGDENWGPDIDEDIVAFDGKGEGHKFLGIIWGFIGDTMAQSEIRIVSYWSEKDKLAAIKAFENLGHWEIDSASTDDLNVGFSDLIRDAEKTIKPKFDCEDNSYKENWSYCGKKECASCGGY